MFKIEIGQKVGEGVNNDWINRVSLMIIFFLGEPDLLDALIYFLMKW